MGNIFNNFVCLCVFGTIGFVNCGLYLSPYSQRQQQSECDITQIEHSIATLKFSINEKFDSLTTSLMDVNKHLTSLEYQTTVDQNGIAELRNEIRKLAGTIKNMGGQKSLPEGQVSIVDRKIDDIAQGTHLSTAALTLLTKDIYALKKNVSDLLEAKWSKLQEEPKVLESKNECPQNESPKNCKEIRDNDLRSPSGIYSVKPNLQYKEFMVFCDMEMTEGGWLVIQNRFDGSQDFYLDYNQYKMGFGNLAGEFWLGLEKIYILTGNKISELLIELTDSDNVNTTAYYSSFSIGPEEEGYPLKVLSGYQGDAGDSLSYQAGQKFSTKDKDQDSWIEGSCAQSHGGAWWYKTCDKSNLNGRYFTPGPILDEMIYQGMYWNGFKGPQYSLLRARMMIR